jgi:uncharacterized membrane protein (UPF0182 family)
MYLRVNVENSIPEMKRVIAAYYVDKIVLSENIDNALNQLLNNNIVNNTGILSNKNNQQKLDIIKRAKEIYDNSMEIEKGGDWAKY